MVSGESPEIINDFEKITIHEGETLGELELPVKLVLSSRHQFVSFQFKKLFYIFSTTELSADSQLRLNCFLCEN